MLLWRFLSLFILTSSFQSSESIYWPAGSYGIPRAASGCPYGDGFQWLIGWRYQDTEDENPNSFKSAKFHLDATVGRSAVERSFCLKTDRSTDMKRSPWPPGKYCIYRKGGSCPANLSWGRIKWDDEDDSNSNHISGTLPDGLYGRNTEIEFCCRTDGDKRDPISLPTTTPFFLLAYESAECQQVKWAVVNVEWIRFDNEDTLNADSQEGTHPYGAGIDNHKIHYCYYQGCNETLTGFSGTFQSPNYPGKYPDGQYCSWKITVSLGRQIRLRFTTFNLQHENNTDSLYVYDGEDVPGNLLGVFYGDHPPPKEGICSSYNHMTIIFKSDKSGSYTGFSASYYAVKCLESVHWPAGSYGIPKAASGCPYDDDFQWLIGRRYQDTEDGNSNNYKSAEFHLDAIVNKNDIERSFCVKTDTSTDIKRNRWPPGKYCIYKKGGSCPVNLSSGFIKWDDEDTANINYILGTLPDGVYDKNTKIEFCCRTDGDKNDPVSLPTVVPFFLLAYESAECQQVKWAVVSVEWIRFDNEDHKNTDDHGGTSPYGAGIGDHTIHYCYYQGCNETMIGVSGTFHSPNYPGKYPDGQYCSWTMTVNPGKQIHLIFTSFSLQSENNTDGLYVYDGENARGEMLGVFYGGNPPPKEGINSTSNHMFVIFKSDKSDSYTGFRASYHAAECLACNSVPTVEQSSSPRSIYLSSSSSSYTASALTRPTVASPRSRISKLNSSQTVHPITSPWSVITASSRKETVIPTWKIPTSSPRIIKMKSSPATLKTSKIVTSSYTKQQMASSVEKRTLKATHSELTSASARSTLKIEEMTSYTLNPATSHSPVIKASSNSEPELSTPKAVRSLSTVYATCSHPLGLSSSSQANSTIKTTSIVSTSSTLVIKIMSQSDVLATMSHSPETASLTSTKPVTSSSTIDTSTKETNNQGNDGSSSFLQHVTSVSSIAASFNAQPVITIHTVATSRLQYSEMTSSPASLTKTVLVITSSYRAKEITSSYTELNSTASEKSKLAISSSSDTKLCITSPTVISSKSEVREITSATDVFSTILHSLGNTKIVKATTTISSSCSGIKEIREPSTLQPTISHFPDKSSPSKAEPVVTTTSVAKLISRVSESSSANESVKTKPAEESSYTKAKITSYHTEPTSTSSELSRTALTPSLNNEAVIATFISASSSQPLRETTTLATAHPTKTHSPGTTLLSYPKELSITTSVDASGSQINRATSLTTSPKTTQTLGSSFTQLELNSTVPDMTPAANEQPERVRKSYKRIGFNAIAVIVSSVLAVLSAVVIVVGSLFYKRKKVTEGEGTITEKPHLSTKQHHQDEVDDDDIELDFI